MYVYGHVCVGAVRPTPPSARSHPARWLNMWLTMGQTALRWWKRLGLPSRRWAQQWYGLVVGVAWRIPALSPPGWLSILRPSYTLEVFAAHRSAQTPRGVSSVTRDAATHKSALSREYRDGHDTTSKRGGKGDSPSSGAAGLHHTARFASVARTRQLRGSSGNRRRRQATRSCPCM